MEAGDTVVECRRNTNAASRRRRKGYTRIEVEVAWVLYWLIGIWDRNGFRNWVRIWIRTWIGMWIRLRLRMRIRMWIRLWIRMWIPIWFKVYFRVSTGKGCG